MKERKKKLIDWVTHHPDFRTLLPSKVREYLSAYFLNKLETSGLDYLADPKYRRVDALQEFRHVEGVNIDQVVELYNSALTAYNRKHPKCWDNEKQQAFRS